MGWDDVGHDKIKAVHELAAEYSKTQSQPIDSEDAAMLADEALIYALAIVFGQGMTLRAFSILQKGEKDKHAPK